VGPQQNFQPHSSTTLQTPIFFNNNIFPVEYQTLASTTHSCDSTLIKITITIFINTTILNILSSLQSKQEQKTDHQMMMMMMQGGHSVTNRKLLKIKYHRSEEHLLLSKKTSI